MEYFYWMEPNYGKLTQMEIIIGGYQFLQSINSYTVEEETDHEVV